MRLGLWDEHFWFKCMEEDKHKRDLSFLAQAGIAPNTRLPNISFLSFFFWEDDRVVHLSLFLSGCSICISSSIRLELSCTFSPIVKYARDVILLFQLYLLFKVTFGRKNYWYLEFSQLIYLDTVVAIILWKASNPFLGHNSGTVGTTHCFTSIFVF